MKELSLIIVPLAAAALAFVWPNERSRPWLLPMAGGVHLLLALWLLIVPPVAAANSWLGFDPLARAVLPMISLLFCVCSIYGVTYLRQRTERKTRSFIGALLALLGLMSLAVEAQNLGLLWVAVEASTLATIPLLHFNGTGRAYEAAWKYLLICGTGVALSLLGSFCLGYASLYNGGSGNLAFASLVQQGTGLSHAWVVTAWLLLLVGYGTKMGLAPMHAWKPDVYGEAPGMVGALMAGGLTTMAFVAILRVKQVVDAADAAGNGHLTQYTLLTVGLLSMLVAALFLLGTRDYKRMLAYSSVEQMGILAVGAALGGVGIWAALFHTWTNGFTKGSLFLSAGNIRRATGAQTADKVAGAAWRSPASARLLIVGILAITACPPFGPFFSVMKVVFASFQSGQTLVAAIFLGCLLFTFFGLTRLAFAIVDGRPRVAAVSSGKRIAESRGVILPPLLLLVFSLWLGLATPSVLRTAWTAAAKLLAPTP